MRTKYFKFVLIAPALFIVSAVAIYPILFALVTSFRDWRLAQSLTPGAFIGFENYARALQDDTFLNSLWVTLIYVIISVAMSVAVGLLMAILLQRKGSLTAITKVVLIMPYAVAPALKGFSWKFMLDPNFGIFDAQIDTLFPFWSSIVWLGHPFWALFMIAITEVWGWAPLIALMFLGALGSVNPEVMEAAKVDGANDWTVFWKITLPLLSPVILLATLLRIIFSLKLFDQVATMTSGGPGRSTEVLNWFVYKTGFRFFDMGYASALSYILMGIMFIVAYFYVKTLFRKEPV